MHAPIIIKPTGESFDFGGLGVNWKIDGKHSGERFSVIHHPIAPHALAAPLHYHHNENEYSFVLKGTLGALLGEEVVMAEVGLPGRSTRSTTWRWTSTACQDCVSGSACPFRSCSKKKSPSSLTGRGCKLEVFLMISRH